MYDCITDRTIYNSTSAQILESPIGENSVLQGIRGHCFIDMFSCHPSNSFCYEKQQWRACL